MLFCHTCIKNPAVYFDGSTNQQWCEVCVPRGCSCNNEYIFDGSSEDFTFEEELQQILKKVINKNKDLYKILITHGYVKNKQMNLKSDTKWKPLSTVEYNLILNDPKSFIEKNINAAIKLIPLDDKGREFPCCEIHYSDDLLNTNIIFYSTYFKEFVKISNISNDKKSFQIYPIIDQKVTDFTNNKEFYNMDFYKEVSNLDYNFSNLEKIEQHTNQLECDYNNPRWYPLNGISDNTDVLIDPLLLKEPFVYLLLVLASDFQMEDYSDIEPDFFYELEEHFEEQKISKESIFKNDNYLKLTKILKDNIAKQFKLSDEFHESHNTKLTEITEEESIYNILLFIFSINSLNNDISSNMINDSSINYGCDCGCGGDMLEDEDYYYYLTTSNLDDSNRRDFYFAELFHIFY